MASTDFNGLMEEWKRWAKAAERTNEGWQSDFPKWDLLIAAAIEALCGPMPDEDTLRLLAECWAAAEEGEDLLERAKERIDRCFPGVEALAASSLPACRWQIYEAAAAAGPRSERLLRVGLTDSDGYARRRAVLALARVKPRDAQDIARRLMEDRDPYIRQAAIEMVLASEDEAFREMAIRTLASDPVQHVRDAARQHLDE